MKDKRNPNVMILAASQTKDKTALTEDGVLRVISELKELVDFIICDSPAGIESGLLFKTLFVRMSSRIPTESIVKGLIMPCYSQIKQLSVPTQNYRPFATQIK